MAKLYAEIDSDKRGRKASKGGDTFLSIDIARGNKTIGTLRVYEVEGADAYRVHWHDEKWERTELVDTEGARGKRCTHCGAVTKTRLMHWHCTNCGRNN